MVDRDQLAQIGVDAAGVLLLVLMFRTSSGLASAYGISVQDLLSGVEFYGEMLDSGTPAGNTGQVPNG